MEFAALAGFYERLEYTTKRLEMRDILVELFRSCEPEDAEKIAYLTLGSLYPAYRGVELGMAEKLALRALKTVARVDEQRLEAALARLGDAGLVAEELMKSMKTQSLLFSEPLTVSYVYGVLEKIARASGEGAVEAKVKLLSGLLAQASPREAKYLMRLVTGKMRLGVADMTILDALAVLQGGGKEAREVLERAYNLTSDIGIVTRVAKEAGLEKVAEIGIMAGRPVRPMLAERLTSSEEILEKLGGRGFAEYKYDGERMQIHKLDSEVMIFSRRQENITAQYPDVVDRCRRNILGRSAIVECEAVAMDPDTGFLLPFQELMHRRRKYDIEKAMEMYPVNLFFFDALMINGEPLIDLPLPERRRYLSEIIEPGELIGLSTGIEVSDPEGLDSFMQRAVEDGCEGVIVKDMSERSVYKAGARGWLWIKYKRSYVSKLVDTLDLVVIGAFHGRGKRTGRYGALLMAAYDDEADVFKSICKVGTGFKDEDLEKLHELLAPLLSPQRPARVESLIEPDVWVKPSIVLELIGDEITLSPVHTAGYGKVARSAGLAVRFPRFTGRYRLDKAPEDATTIGEVIDMYRSQLKVVQAEGESEPT